MAPADTSRGASKSGIVEGANGERCIPASVRPDGSIRKEIKIRPGYKPPEDVEKYKSRPVAARRSIIGGGVPGASFLDPPKPKKPSDAAAVAGSSTTSAASPKVTKENASQVATTPAKEEDPVDPEAEKLKEVRKLSKKLRQARELQQKTREGGPLLPEQIQKVVQINDLTRRLELLGFDQEGKKKGES